MRQVLLEAKSKSSRGSRKESCTRDCLPNAGGPTRDGEPYVLGSYSSREPYGVGGLKYKCIRSLPILHM
jgi:hypothetical protein